MKNMRLCLIALMSITALLLASCAAVPGSTTIPTSTGSVSVGGEDLMAAVKAAPNQGAIQVPEPDFLTGISRFSATLLLESGKNKGNVMVSPLSVFLALAMTVNGADSDTRDDMLKVLTDGALTVDQVNEVSRNLIGLLEKSEPKTQVAIANSIWFRQGFKPFQPFLQANADYYGAGARSLDFSSDSATEAINGWVERETMGLIEKIVNRISPTTVMYLINTVYFKSDWQEPFLKHETRAQTFQTPDGGIEVDFMHRTAPMAYFTGQDAIGVALPYAN
ncbi:MAG: serpin family protein, partial [Eubacteriales bacterium]|nr:serpin family protein [Eubacteriales bacterium]